MKPTTKSVGPFGRPLNGDAGPARPENKTKCCGKGAHEDENKEEEEEDDDDDDDDGGGGGMKDRRPPFRVGFFFFFVLFLPHPRCCLCSFHVFVGFFFVNPLTTH